MRLARGSSTVASRSLDASNTWHGSPSTSSASRTNDDRRSSAGPARLAANACSTAAAMRRRVTQDDGADGRTATTEPSSHRPASDPSVEAGTSSSSPVAPICAASSVSGSAANGRWNGSTKRRDARRIDRHDVERHQSPPALHRLRSERGEVDRRIERRGLTVDDVDGEDEGAPVANDRQPGDGDRTRPPGDGTPSEVRRDQRGQEGPECFAADELVIAPDAPAVRMPRRTGPLDAIDGGVRRRSVDGEVGVPGGEPTEQIAVLGLDDESVDRRRRTGR